MNEATRQRLLELEPAFRAEFWMRACLVRELGVNDRRPPGTAITFTDVRGWLRERGVLVDECRYVGGGLIELIGARLADGEQC